MVDVVYCNGGGHRSTEFRASLCPQRLLKAARRRSAGLLESCRRPTLGPWRACLSMEWATVSAQKCRCGCCQHVDLCAAVSFFAVLLIIEGFAIGLGLNWCHFSLAWQALLSSTEEVRKTRKGNIMVSFNNFSPSDSVDLLEAIAMASLSYCVESIIPCFIVSLECPCSFTSRSARVAGECKPNLWQVNYLELGESLAIARSGRQ
eukprot:scaffold135559_cov53-Prasinocladus_malaysianus.AAC.1